MIADDPLDARLSILRTGDRLRKWNSLDDQRVCSVCERKFKGRQIEIRCFRRGRYTLHCPTLGCTSEPHQWLYPRAAVVSKIDKPGWWGANKQAARREAESMPQARRHQV